MADSYSFSCNATLSQVRLRRRSSSSGLALAALAARDRDVPAVALLVATLDDLVLRLAEDPLVVERDELGADPVLRDVELKETVRVPRRDPRVVDKLLRDLWRVARRLTLDAAAAAVLVKVRAPLANVVVEAVRVAVHPDVHAVLLRDHVPLLHLVFAHVEVRRVVRVDDLPRRLRRRQVLLDARERLVPPLLDCARARVVHGAAAASAELVAWKTVVARVPERLLLLLRQALVLDKAVALAADLHHAVRVGVVRVDVKDVNRHAVLLDRLLVVVVRQAPAVRVRALVVRLERELLVQVRQHLFDALALAELVVDVAANVVRATEVVVPDDVDPWDAVERLLVVHVLERRLHAVRNVIWASAVPVDVVTVADDRKRRRRRGRLRQDLSDVDLGPVVGLELERAVRGLAVLVAARARLVGRRAPVTDREERERLRDCRTSIITYPD